MLFDDNKPDDFGITKTGQLHELMVLAFVALILLGFFAKVLFI